MAGGPPFTLTLNGTNFNFGDVTLVWNGTTQIQAAMGSNSTQVSFAIPASLIANPGTLSLQLIDPVPGDRPSNIVSFTITPRGPTACALFGTYDFSFTGFDTNTKGFGRAVARMMAVGAFGVDAKGNVSGEQDYDFYPYGGGFNAVFSGTCSNGATPQEGTLTFKFNDSNIQDTLIYTFVLQQGGSGPPRGRFLEPSQQTSFFATISGSGTFMQSVPDSVLNGDYAFGLFGMDASIDRQIGAVGRFTDVNGNLTTGVADINDGGVVTSDTSASGLVVLPTDAFSRIQMSLTVGGQKIWSTVYVNSQGLGFAISNIFTPLGHNAVVGFITSQANAGSYDNSSLSVPVVFDTLGSPPPLYTGSSYTAASDTTIGVASGFASTAGTFNLLQDNVSGGVAKLNQNIAGVTYNIATSGRATVSYTSGRTTNDFVYYLDNANDGYILSLGNAVDFGFFQPQAAGPFSTGSVNGAFASGTFFPATPTSPNLVTEITLNNGTLSASTPSGALTGTYAVSPSGRGMATVNLPVLGGPDLVFYVISSTNIVSMCSDSTSSDAITLMHF